MGGGGRTAWPVPAAPAMLGLRPGVVSVPGATTPESAAGACATHPVLSLGRSPRIDVALCAVL